MNNIYREELLEIYRSPLHRGRMLDPTAEYTKVNSFCGDRVTVQLKVRADRIEDIKYMGEACAVSIIASSLLADHLIGKTIREALEFSRDDLLSLVGVNLTTSRVKCATLLLEALHEALGQVTAPGGRAQNK